MYSTMKSVPAFACVLTIGATVCGQWSDDPALNMAIGDKTGAQVQPKILATSDGGCYVSWFDNSAGGYDVYLQRLDATGAELWAHNGMLIADRSFSSTQDYGLAVDGADHALLTFRDDRFGGVRITAQKISPDGGLPWGANGVQFGDGSGFVASPKIAATTDGLVDVAWTSDSDVMLQQLDAAGSPLWTDGVTLSDSTGGSLSVADLHGADAGSVIVSMVRSGPMYWDPKHIWAQKLSTTGEALWDASYVRVFDGGSLQMGNFPPFVPDGLGGAVFSWYGVTPLQSYVQHILAGGTEKFTHNGVAVSTLSSQVRVSPRAAYNPDTDEVFCFWREQNSGQSQSGVYGQKFDSAGSRLWGSTGQVIVPVSDTERTNVNCLTHGEGAMVFYIESPEWADDRVHAALVKADGGFAWEPAITVASSVSSGKSRLAAAPGAGGSALLAWSDARADDGDIFGQNVNADGSLGAAELVGDINGDGAVDVLDLIALLGAWGDCPDPPADCPADLDDNGVVDVLDLIMLLGHWS